jgi:hypothetical protein
MMRMVCPTATAARLFPRRGQSAVLRPEVGVLLACPCVSRLYEQCSQPGAALARPPAASLAGAFVVARTHAGPTRQVSGCRKAAHVRAELRYEEFGRPATDTRNRRQPLQFSRIRAQPFSDLRAHVGDTGIQKVDVSQLPRQQEALMRTNAPGEGSLPCRELLPQPALGQLRHRRRIGLATY